MDTVALGFVKAEDTSGTTPRIAFPSLWYVPYDRNPYFTDQKNLVERLHERLSAEEVGASRQAISGLGGIGKTQLALEYAYRYQHKYTAVLWVGAGTQPQLIKDFAHIATLLQVPESQKTEPRQRYLVNEALGRLQAESGWLLILDNVEEDYDEKNADSVEESLKIDRIFAMLKKGHILLTTRAQSIARLVQNFLLEEMQPEEGAQLLLLRNNQLSSPDILSAADETKREGAFAVAHLLGGLPLALEQARAYIEATGCGFAGYRQLYEEYRQNLLAWVVKGSRLEKEYQKSVATTWLISYRHVEQQFEVASEVLKLCAYLAPDAIPENIVLKGAERLTSNLHQLAGNRFQFNHACEVLCNFSLIKRNGEEAVLSIHRLIQAVLQDSMEDAVQHFWAEQAVRAVEHAFLAATGQEVEQYIPHAQTCVAFIERYHLEGEEVAYLLKMVAKAVDERGWYAQAQPLYIQAFIAYSHHFGPDDNRTLHLLFDVLHIQIDMGGSPFAANVYAKIIADCERVLGPDHPDLLVLLTNVTWARLAAGDYAGAAETGAKALQLLDRIPNVDTIERAKTYQVGAELAVLLGKADLVEAYYREARTLFEQAVGPEHREVANTLANWGAFHAMRGNLEQAERLLRQALEIRQRTIGPDHPETADGLVALAAIVWQQSRYSDAEGYYRQALTIRQQKLGPYHSDVLQTLRSLAQLAAAQKQDEEAERYFREALALAPQAKATASYEYVLLLKAYADYLRARGRMNDADKLQQDEH